MKTCIAFTTTAIITAATFKSAIGLSIYLDELPNGESFSQALGHPGDDSSKFTDFATAFADAGHTWSSDFCGQAFPGSSMTNGAAFGDPCCTWKKGGSPDFAVAAFTTTPGDATVCASTTDSSTEAPAATETPTTEAPTTNAPATETPSTTESPSTETTTTNAPVTEVPITTAPCTTVPETADSLAFTDTPSTTDPPVVTDPPATESPVSGGCAAKSDGTQVYRRFRH